MKLSRRKSSAPDNPYSGSNDELADLITVLAMQIRQEGPLELDTSGLHVMTFNEQSGGEESRGKLRRTVGLRFSNTYHNRNAGENRLYKLINTLQDETGVELHITPGEEYHDMVDISRLLLPENRQKLRDAVHQGNRRGLVFGIATGAFAAGGVGGVAYGGHQMDNSETVGGKLLGMAEMAAGMGTAYLFGTSTLNRVGDAFAIKQFKQSVKATLDEINPEQSPQRA